MARTQLRPDITAARTKARLSPGSGRELTRLEEMLGVDEAVEAMAQARYQGCFGLAVLTDARLIFLCDGVIWKVSDDIALERIGLVQWQSVFGFGTLTVHVAGTPLEFTGITGTGGGAVLRGLREHLAEKDRIERLTRESVLSLTARFKPEPAQMTPDFMAGV
ncbi:hypothetical protein GCM10023063_18670 [Arthrobacter methylotrophus]|uniref:YokE-like PH domain-containing protein n=1 Tax=Arthrobacter methylotrophus TaxID=121291 RepID=A0ABV5UP24_9MICC